MGIAASSGGFDVDCSFVAVRGSTSFGAAVNKPHGTALPEESTESAGTPMLHKTFDSDEE